MIAQKDIWNSLTSRFSFLYEYRQCNAWKGPQPALSFPGPDLFSYPRHHILLHHPAEKKNHDLLVNRYFENEDSRMAVPLSYFSVF